METMLEKLKRKFALQSREEILETWNSGNEWDTQETKAKDYLSHINISLGVGAQKINLGNVKINNILGSNLYSNLFFNINFPLNATSIFSVKRLSIY